MVNNRSVFDINTTMIELVDIAAEEIIGDTVNPTE